MKKRDQNLVLEAIESDRAERSTLGFNRVICKALHHKCRECVRFNCRKRTEKWKYVSSKTSSTASRRRDGSSSEEDDITGSRKK